MKISSLDVLPEQSVSHNPKIQKRVMIAPGEIEGVMSFSQASFPPGEIAGRHVHADMTEVFLVQQGQGEMSVDDVLIRLDPGVCIVVEPGESHEIRNTGDEALVVTYFGIGDQSVA